MSLAFAGGFLTTSATWDVELLTQTFPFQRTHLYGSF